MVTGQLAFVTKPMETALNRELLNKNTCSANTIKSNLRNTRKKQNKTKQNRDSSTFLILVCIYHVYFTWEGLP